MGRLEKQIIAGALSLVAVLLSVVVFKGLRPHEDGADAEAERRSRWNVGGTPSLAVGGRALSLDSGSGADEGAGAEEQRGAFRDAAAGPRAGSEVALQDAAAGGGDGRPDAAEGDAKPAPPAEEPAGPVVYVVRESDSSLGEIARRELGAARYWREIAKLNPEIDPHAIFPGQRILIPTREQIRRQERARREAQGESGTETVPEGVRTHTVKRGDALWDLAKHYYGDPNGVARIIEANPHKLDEGEHTTLTEGWVLVIPE